MFISMKAQCKQYIKRISFQSKKIIILLVKMIHFPNKLRSHLVVIVRMAPFTLNLTWKLRSALHFRYSIVIRSLSLIAIASSFLITSIVVKHFRLQSLCVQWLLTVHCIQRWSHYTLISIWHIIKTTNIKACRTFKTEFWNK